MTVKIGVQIDSSNWLGRMKTTEKNLVYSTVQAINDTVKEIQQRQRADMDKDFVLRKRDFMLRTVKIFEFASVGKGKIYAVVGIDSKKARLLLPLFESGGTKTPAKGANVAVPITGGPARPDFGQAVGDQFLFKNLKFKRSVTKTGKVQWKGTNNTYLIPGVGVFQRTDVGTSGKRAAAGTGAGRAASMANSRMVYRFRKTTPVSKKMDFMVLAQRVYNTTFAQALAQRSKGQL